MIGEDIRCALAIYFYCSILAYSSYLLCLSLSFYLSFLLSGFFYFDFSLFINFILDR